MRTIPEIRRRLYALAMERGIPELRDLADDLHRRPAVGRAPVRSRPMTPTLRAEIARWMAENPGRTQHEAAAHFNVNPGRVSEALRGKR